MHDQLRVLRHSTLASWKIFTAFYTWKTWTFTWVSRLLIQVCFYAVIGRLLGSQEQVDYLLIGNAVSILAMDAMAIILMATGERQSGTLPLMVAAPATHLTVYLGRGVVYLGSGVAASTVAFLLLPPIFGVWLPWPNVLAVPLMLVVVGIGCYCYGACIASVVLGFPSARFLALNVSYLTLATFCGVNVSTAFWPPWLQGLIDLLPMSHGLRAIRSYVRDGASGFVVSQLALELVVAAGWCALAAIGFQLMVTRGRRDGTIEYAS
ncbi:ABC transporter permease [Lentzea flaviverrucosa]|uniref:ABC-2 type transport system permease protein n=1 Tax=Lentzea flaviverrucosa TaxID=200379 RepID=A0A1H9WVH4_9PSEU|nr:ABC transporter permease [Lentzea flaviverrucosa]RDI23106.1 ABC-2 type transport system permease protein [Lentzea flaviverrucosa]SES37423.1 ABC-2 type transport system permease protein [Lentzea flaviverrucosa]